MDLVVGATGFLGTEICRQLIAQGQRVRALVRATSDPAKKAALQNLGVELIEGDLKDAASLAAACQGVTAVLSTATSIISQQAGDSFNAVDLDGQINLIEAAKTAGVAQFVYVSFSGQIETDSPLRTAKRAVEQHLQQSGLSYTILRPTNFMEVWLSPVVGFDVANATATVYGSGHNKISWISLVDVAQFAVASLTNPAARNAVLELGGPEALSPLEVIAQFEAVTGKPFTVQHVPEEALQAQHAAATDPMQRTFAALMLSTARGDVIDMTATLQAFPLNLTSISEFIRRS